MKKIHSSPIWSLYLLVVNNFRMTSAHMFCCIYHYLGNGDIYSYVSTPVCMLAAKHVYVHLLYQISMYSKWCAGDVFYLSDLLYLCILLGFPIILFRKIIHKANKFW